MVQHLSPPCVSLSPQSCFFLTPAFHSALSPAFPSVLLLHKLRQLAQILPRQRPQAADTVIFQRPIVFSALADHIAQRTVTGTTQAHVYQYMRDVRHSEPWHAPESAACSRNRHAGIRPHHCLHV